MVIQLWNLKEQPPKTCVDGNLFLFHIYCICHSVDMALLLSHEKKFKFKGTLCSEIKTLYL